MIGRFLSVDPVGFLETGEPRFFNRYSYCYNDPINCIDPDGLYGSGGDWKDEDWEQFDAAQQQASKDIGKALGNLDAAKNGDADAISAFQDTFGSDGDLNARIDEVVTTLTGVKEALDSTTDFMAYAEPDAGSSALANGDLGGNTIGVNTAHPSFGDTSALSFGAVHEGAHNVGLSHQRSPNGSGFSSEGNRFGSHFERKAFGKMKTLNPAVTVRNPDHVTSFIYP